ncbi:MAG: non-canonical purine NTP pyrophosphatase [Patescibacteria group bacterium]|nr:non-canonical purine NTP pyrophosphatase [Patescibacteria group bacterium]
MLFTPGLLKQFCVGTRNQKKLEELYRLLDGIGIDLVVPPEDVPEPDEPYDSFASNAMWKAWLYAKVVGVPVFAEDSGIVVPALSRRFGFPFPGVYSARLCLFNIIDGKLRDFGLERVPPEDRALVNNRLLRALMTGLRGEDRHAYYVASIAVVRPDRALLYDQECSSIPGEIITERRGDNGFGYDPIVFVPRVGKTYAEMTDEEKDVISHRGKAMRHFAAWLRDMSL